jgi:UDP-glucose 6-dehydrogenase
MKIAIADIRYLGLYVDVLLAQQHLMVTLDILPVKVDLINQYQITFYLRAARLPCKQAA